MQHLEGSGTPVLYIGRTVLKGYICYISCSDRGVGVWPSSLRYATWGGLVIGYRHFGTTHRSHLQGQ
jgi:hypothetical protein